MQKRELSAAGWAQTPQQDDEQYLRELMGHYGSDVKRVCLMYLKDVYLAEDAAQETFVKAWRGLGSFRRESSERTWLMHIAVNVCRDMLRTPWMRRNDRHVPAEELLVNVPWLQEEHDITEAVLALPVRSREVILLCCFQGLTMEEAARALGISLAAVRSRLHRAKETLKTTIKEGWEA